MTHNNDQKEFLTDDLIDKLFNNESQIVLKNGKPQDVYLCDDLIPTVLCAMYELSVAVQQMMNEQRSNTNEVYNRFNPLQFMGEILMRKNPKYVPEEKMAIQFRERCRKFRVKKIFKAHDKLVQSQYNKIKDNFETDKEEEHMTEILQLLNTQFNTDVFTQIKPIEVMEGEKQLFNKFEKFQPWIADQVKSTLWKQIDLDKFPTLPKTTRD